jgi:hypothetical protein
VGGRLRQQRVGSETLASSSTRGSLRQPHSSSQHRMMKARHRLRLTSRAAAGAAAGTRSSAMHTCGMPQRRLASGGCWSSTRWTDSSWWWRGPVSKPVRQDCRVCRLCAELRQRHAGRKDAELLEAVLAAVYLDCAAGAGPQDSWLAPALRACAIVLPESWDAASWGPDAFAAPAWLGSCGCLPEPEPEWKLPSVDGAARLLWQRFPAGAEGTGALVARERWLRLQAVGKAAVDLVLTHVCMVRWPAATEGELHALHTLLTQDADGHDRADKAERGTEAAWYRCELLPPAAAIEQGALAIGEGPTVWEAETAAATGALVAELPVDGVPVPAGPVPESARRALAPEPLVLAAVEAAAAGRWSLRPTAAVAAAHRLSRMGSPFSVRAAAAGVDGWLLGDVRGTDGPQEPSSRARCSALAVALGLAFFGGGGLRLPSTPGLAGATQAGVPDVCWVGLSIWTLVRPPTRISNCATWYTGGRRVATAVGMRTIGGRGGGPRGVALVCLARWGQRAAPQELARRPGWPPPWWIPAVSHRTRGARS